MMVAKKTSTDKPKRPRPIRKAVLRGLLMELWTRFTLNGKAPTLHPSTRLTANFRRL